MLGRSQRARSCVRALIAVSFLWNAFSGQALGQVSPEAAERIRGRMRSSLQEGVVAPAPPTPMAWRPSEDNGNASPAADATPRENAAAANRTSSNVTAAADSVSAGPVDVRRLLWSVSFGLGTVLTSLIAFAVVAKWLQRGAGAHGRRLRIVETLGLGARCWLQLVEADERNFLVACDARGVRQMLSLEQFAADLASFQDDAEDEQLDGSLLAAYRQHQRNAQGGQTDAA